jgi:hypothetical protein
MKAVLIDTGKHPDEPLYASFWFWLPPNSPYGNLQLKLLKMRQRLDEANRRLVDGFSFWEQARTDLNAPTVAIERHVNAIEQAIYLMSRAADDMIALSWCLYRREVTGRYPAEITVDCTDAALAHGGNDSLRFWQDHAESLADLNNVTNAYRHAFLNLDLNLVDAYEPRVHALSLNKRRPKSGVQFHDVSLAALVRQFSEFNAAGMRWLEDFSERHSPQKRSEKNRMTMERPAPV